MEIVGVVLGAIPLLDMGVKSLRTVIENTKAFAAFETYFSGILRGVELSMFQFEQNIALLRIILQRHTPNRWGANDTTVDWTDPLVRKALEEQLGVSFVSWLLETVRRQDDIIDDISNLLTKGKDLAHMSWSGKAQFRLEISFSDISKLILQLKELNEEVWQIVSRKEKLEVSRLRLTTAASSTTGLQLDQMMETIWGLQRYAHSLCQWLCGPEWDCGCLPSHNCGITASCYKDDVDSKSRSPYLELLMGGPSKLARVEIVLKDSSSRAQASHEKVLTLTRELQVLGTGAGTSKSIAPHQLQTSALPLPSEAPKSRPKKLRKKKRVRSMRPDATEDNPEHHGSTKNRCDTGPPTPRPTLKISCSIFVDPAKALHTAPSRMYHQPLEAGLGRLEFGDHYRAVHDDDVKPLEQFYRDESRLRRRLQLGLELAYCILGLGGTSWFPGGWGCDDIRVVLSRQSNDDTTGAPGYVAMPFYQHDRVRSELGRDVSDREAQSEMAIFSLGVILLQLLSQKKPDEQASWNDHTNGGEEDELTLWNTVMEWRETVVYPSLAVKSAADNCIDLDFGMTPVDLQGPRFVRKFLEMVVLPLEQAVRPASV